MGEIVAGTVHLALDAKAQEELLRQGFTAGERPVQTALFGPVPSLNPAYEALESAYNLGGALADADYQQMGRYATHLAASLIPWGKRKNVDFKELLKDERGAISLSRQMHEHHIFPKKWRDQFLKLGIDVDQWAALIPGDEHIGANGLHNRFDFDEQWQDFFDQPNPTAEAAIHLALDQLNTANITNTPAAPYKGTPRNKDAVDSYYGQ